MIDRKTIYQWAKDREAKAIGFDKKCSVLVPIVMVDGEIHILFEKRSMEVSQPGEISFPGGFVEKDESFLKAAIRETKEEINGEKIKIYGQANSIYSHGGTIIEAFIGELIDYNIESFEPNDEVAKIFTVPLEFFMKNNPDIYYSKIYSEQEDGFPYDLIPNGKNYNFTIGKSEVHFWKYDGETIWGLTAKILYDFIKMMRDINDTTQ